MLRPTDRTLFQFSVPLLLTGLDASFATAFSKVFVKKERTFDPMPFDDFTWYAESTKNQCCVGAVCISDGFRIDGAWGWEAGVSVATGDVNGDGIEDMILGAPNMNGSGCPGWTCGGVFVVFGTRKGFPNPLPLSMLDGNNGFFITNNEFGPWTQAGASVAVGDVNGDTIKDIIMLCPHCSPNDLEDATSTWVVFGHTGPWSSSYQISALDDGTLGVRLDGPIALNSGTYNYPYVTAGDINGDGFDDIAVGVSGGFYDAPGSMYHTYVVLGHNGIWTSPLNLGTLAGSDSTPKGFRLDGKNPDDNFGEIVAFGDINGDNIKDLVIQSGGTGSCCSFPPPESQGGVLWVVYGRSTGSWDASYPIASLMDGTNGSELLNGWTKGSMGSQMAFADFDGDGITDFAFTNPKVSWCGCSITSIIYGTGSKWPATLTRDASNANSFLTGWQSVAIAAADLDKDGKSELIIGDGSYSPTGKNGAGAAYIVFGTANTNPGKTGWHSIENELTTPLALGYDYFKLEGANAGDAIGWNGQFTSGEVTGDGNRDLIISNSNISASNGGAYVLFGRRKRKWSDVLDLSDF